MVLFPDTINVQQQSTSDLQACQASYQIRSSQSLLLFGNEGEVPDIVGCISNPLKTLTTDA
jgi:hypothetical protein